MISEQGGSSGKMTPKIDTGALVTEWNRQEFADKKVLGKGIEMRAFKNAGDYLAIKKKVQKGRLEIILEEQGDATKR